MISTSHFEFRAIIGAFPYLFDVITVQETWINKSLEPLVELDQYSMVPKHKLKCKEGGGLCIYIRHGLKYKERPDLECPIEKQELFDNVFIEILNPDDSKNNTLIGTIYRPPGASTVEGFTDHLDELLSKISKEKKRVILTGDANINLLKYSQHVPSASFLDMLLSYGMVPKITVPTRVTHSTATLIDHIFVNEGQNVKSSLVGTLETCMSDHYMNFIFLKNESNLTGPKTVTYRPYTEKNIIKLKNALSNQEFHELYSTNDPNTAYDILTSTFIGQLDEIIPEKTVRFNKY